MTDPCSCDEALALRLENARLKGIIEGLREGLGLRLGRCISVSPDGCSKCELSEFHGGPHKRGATVWSYG